MNYDYNVPKGSQLVSLEQIRNATKGNSTGIFDIFKNPLGVINSTISSIRANPSSLISSNMRVVGGTNNINQKKLIMIIIILIILTKKN